VGAEAETLRGLIEAWSLTIGEPLAEAHPKLPDALTDRQQDGTEPLLAIADIAGGQWPQAARRALVELCAEAQAADDSTGKLVLTDIRQVFDGQGVDRIGSTDLAYLLSDIETS